MTTYPTGVENHGGTLRIWFIYKGARARENLGVPDTPKNRKMAGELRTSIGYEIKTGTFNYSSRFQSSTNLKRFGFVRQGATLGEPGKSWLELKRMEITRNAHLRYVSYITIVTELLGPARAISSLSNEDMLRLRKELLTGNQIC